MARPLRTLVVDDEPLARDRLGELLRQVQGIEVVAFVGSAADAISKIADLAPDLVLLDIEMPKVDGFDVVESLQLSQSEERTPPLICFVTAYPHFAADAFESGALDFLCKPVRLGRLQKAIERAKVALEQREAKHRMRELLGQLDALRQTRTPVEDRSIWLHHRGEMTRIPVDSIDWVKAEGEYVRLQLGERSYLLRNSITAVANDLAAEGFIRIHRSFVVNANRLSAMRSSRNSVNVELTNGSVLPVGRRFKEAVRSWISGRSKE